MPGSRIEEIPRQPPDPAPSTPGRDRGHNTDSKLQHAGTPQTLPRVDQEVAAAVTVRGRYRRQRLVGWQCRDGSQAIPGLSSDPV